MKCPKCRTENAPGSKFCRECATPVPSAEKTPGHDDAQRHGLKDRPIFTETLADPPQELVTGSIFAGRYQIIEELGAGGMGRVYRALDRKLNEEVALKLIRPEIASERKTLERFRNELRTARRISHRHIGRMYELMEEKGTHFITMEYVRGEDLKSAIRRFGRLPVGKALSVAKQVAEGLAEAHRIGVVHRDLKPGNIMIDREGNARILDFGIARSLEEKGITGAGVMIGTPEYMSPEQAEAREVDARSDLYSLGVVLFEMATGRLPFEGETALSVAMKHKSEPPPDPKTFNPQLSDDLGRFILQCLEKDIERRYQSAKEMLSALDVIEQGPAAAGEATEMKPGTGRGEKKKWQGSVAVLPFANMSADPEQEYFCDGMAEEIINALTQVEDLRIVARTSAFSFKGKNVSVREIGRELRVEAVLEGSVRKAGNRLRITAQLISVEDGFHLWSARFDRDLADVFAIQDEIALAIVDKLKIKLKGEDQAVLVKRHTADPEAYSLYLKGRRYTEMLTQEGFRRGLDYLERAVTKDPDFALPLAFISYLSFAQSYWGKMRPREAYAKIKEFSGKALEIDDSLGLAYAGSGYAKAFFERDRPGADRDFQKALELNPNSPDIHQIYSLFLTCTNRPDEAVVAARNARELDPLSSNTNSQAANVLFFAGRAEEAVEILKETIALDPSFYHAHYILYLIYADKSMFGEALAECEKAAELSGGHPFSLVGLILHYSRLGRTAEADKLDKSLRDRSQTEYIPPMCFFYIHLGRKELEMAAEWLEQACVELDSFLPWILVHPNPARRIPDLPIFNAILKKHSFIK